MRFDINLATRYYINARRINLAVAAAVILLGVVLAWNITTFTTVSSEIGRLAADVAGKGSGGLKNVSQQEYQALLGKISAANAIIARKSYNWLGLLDQLEGVVPDGVSISSLTPDTKGNALDISGVALNFKGLRTFVEQLEGSRFFTDVFLVSQAENKVSDTQKGITFSITCKVPGK